MVEKAAELAEKHGWFLCHQFETDGEFFPKLRVDFAFRDNFQ